MKERDRAVARRIYVADVRGSDTYLRMTWHDEQRVVVVSQWDGPVCTAATRVDVADAPEIIGFLAGSLADAARPRSAEPQMAARPRPWWKRWTIWLQRHRRPHAQVVAMPEPQPPVRWQHEASG